MTSSFDRESYLQNTESFAAFYALQGEYTAALAQTPAAIGRWLESRNRPTRCGPPEAGSSVADRWRTSRLTYRRRQELAAMLGDPEAGSRLATWLRSCLPVLSLLEMAAEGRTQELAALLTQQRERLFLANYGLAKAAAARGRPDGFDDRLSAACVGLLDAIDRYVPGEQSAQFAYFATYWIRYHIGRQNQKFGGVVAFPIYQQRMGRKLAQLSAQRRERGLAEATAKEACAALAVGADALERHRQRPSVLSIHAPVGGEDREQGYEHLLCDPAPAPGTDYEEAEVAGRIQHWLKRSFPPSTRVMLAYAHDVGALSDAGLEYLIHQREIARERLRFMARGEDVSQSHL